MALEGESISVQHGSDADFRLTCTPCGEDSLREEAVKYCPECEEYLCQTCTRHHGRLKATRSHKLLDKSDAEHGTFIAKAVKCRYHPDRDIEMYCVTHNMVYCLKCITMEHRGSCDVKCIDDTLCSSGLENQFRNLQTDLKEVKAQLTATKDCKEENIALVEKQKNDCLTIVQNIEQKLIEHIQKLKRETTKAVHTKSLEIESELQSDITSIADSITEVEKMSKQVDAEGPSNAELEFIQVKLGQNIIEDARILDTGMKSRNTQMLNVTENADLCDPVMKAVALGNINKETVKLKQLLRQHIRMKSMREINVKMKNDASDCSITDACQLQDGTIILVDCDNKKLKRLDENYNITDYYILEASSYGICCTGPNQVAVKMTNNKLQFLSIATSLTKLRDMPVSGGWSLGIAYSDGEFFVSDQGGVNRYDACGTFKTKIDKTPDGQNIFWSCPAHMLAHNGSIIVTDRHNGAVHVKKDGTVLKEVRNERLKDVHAVCKSNEGTVFLAGRYSHNILMLDEDGTCLGDLVSGGLGDPISMCYDNKKDCIIVSRFQSNTICVVELDKYM